MSAGGFAPRGIQVISSLDYCAPKFATAVEAALADCHAQGYDAVIYETLRSQELQQLYYRRGRPPSAEYPSPVTNASSADRSWHFFGLAVDVVSKAKHWSAPDAWWRAVAEIFQANGCKSGYYWTRKDKPHHHWGKCKVSPSHLSRDAYAEGGLEAVWELVKAI